MRRLLLCVTTFGVVSLGQIAVAQTTQSGQPGVRRETPASSPRRDQQRTQRTPESQADETAQGLNQADQAIASLLSLGAENCVELSRFAEKKATSQAVKQFAQRQNVASQESIKTLTEFGVGRGSPLASDANRRSVEGAERIAASPGQDVADRQASSKDNQRKDRREIEAAQATTSGSLDFLAKKREIQQECLKLTRGNLEEKSGIDFDMAYMGTEIVGLTRGLAMMQVAEQYASPKLKETLSQKIEATQTALRQAEEVVMHLDKNEKRARQPGGSENPTK